MSILLDVQDTIVFERPLTRINKQNIRVENPNSEPVAFKVKTTAPRVYCVRPNSEIIPANGSIEVQIMHQAFKEEPNATYKCKDKFLFQSTFITEKIANLELNDLWSWVEANDKKSIHQHKLRCVYGDLPSSAPVEPVEALKSSDSVAAAKSIQTNETSPTVEENTDYQEKLKQMEDELTKYKDEVNALRAQERVVVEKVQVVKQSSNPFSIIILLALFVAAVAYFVKF